MNFFLSCRSCGELSGPCDTPLRPVLNCCSKPVAERWPPSAALRLLDIAGEQPMQRAEGRRVAIVFLAFAFERLLEEALLPLVHIGKLPTGQGDRKALFEHRTGRRVRALLTEAGLPDFERN